MNTVGAVGSPVAAQEKPEEKKPQTPGQEFQALLNEWAHMLPVAFVNRLESFSEKHLK